MLHYEQVGPANNVGAELAFRRLQTIEYTYLDKVRARSSNDAARLHSEEQALFGGTTRAVSQLMVAPALLDHVRADVEREAGLAKNILKAREVRENLNKSQKKKQGEG